MEILSRSIADRQKVQCDLVTDEVWVELPGTGPTRLYVEYLSWEENLTVVGIWVDSPDGRVPVAESLRLELVEFFRQAHLRGVGWVLRP